MTEQKSGLRTSVQRFGSYLSGMVMPNIGAFIAWGLITALFIPTGWVPNAKFATMVGPMIMYLLPLLIAYTGGKMVYDMRGGVIGAVATMGVIVGTDIPMFLGAMMMGPLAAYLLKKVDGVLQPRTKQGFEMLVNNFASGILGAILAMLAYKGIGPAVETLSKGLGDGVHWIVSHHLLPFASIFIEPAKVLFLNNAINHGVLSPIGIEQAKEAGKSIMFLLEANPGPGLGILLAYLFFGKGTARQTTPGAIIIHFLGGIHEIYFPYILMKPQLIIAAICGGMSGVFTLNVLHGGLVAPASPGSIFAVLAMTPKGAGNYLAVLSGVLVATIVSFVVGAFILKASKDTDEDLAVATEKMLEMKGKKSSVTDSLVGSTKLKDVKKIVFACDAGMGSSAMGASILKNKAKKLGLDVEIINTAINNIPSDADLIVSHQDLTNRAKDKLPSAHHVSVENFLNSPKYDELLESLKK